MKVKLMRDEWYQVNSIKTVEVEIPDDVEDIEGYIREYIDSDDSVDAFGDIDPEDRWSDVTDTYYEVWSEDGIILEIKQ